MNSASSTVHRLSRLCISLDTSAGQEMDKRFKDLTSAGYMEDKSQTFMQTNGRTESRARQDQQSLEETCPAPLLHIPSKIQRREYLDAANDGWQYTLHRPFRVLLFVIILRVVIDLFREIIHNCVHWTSGADQDVGNQNTMMNLSDSENRSALWDVQVSSSGRYVAACGDNVMVKVWDLEQKRLICRRLVHSSIVRAIQCIPDEKQMISVGDDAICVWNFLANRWRSRRAEGNS